MTVKRDPCTDCPLPRYIDRRNFLQLAMVAFGGALNLRLGRAIWSRDEEHAYPIPAADSTIIDKDHQVILVRFEQKMYAFNLSCPHQNTALHWLQDEARFQCPKHKSRYQPDGVFISGRATRNMDRFAVRRDGDNIVVDVDKFYKSDENPADWAAAVLAL